MLDAPADWGGTALRDYEHRVFEATCRRVAADGRDPDRYGAMIRLYAQAYAEWCMTSSKVRDQGVVMKAGNRLVANPNIAVRDAAHLRMERLSSELGLSPSSSIAKDEVWDPDVVEDLEDIRAEMADEAAAAALGAAEPAGEA